MITFEKKLLRIEVKNDNQEELLYNYQKALVLTVKTIISSKDNFISDEACEYFPFYSTFWRSSILMKNN